nr:MAG TPA: hypothetical protein [Caudoviricetes sp.]
MGKLVEFTGVYGQNVSINRDKVVFLEDCNDSTKIFTGSGDYDYVRVAGNFKTVSRKIDGEIRVSFINIAIFVLFLVFIFLKLMQ